MKSALPNLKFKQKPSNQNLIPNHGFTLIEMVIVIATMALLFGLGSANYRDFQRRQQLESTVREFKGDLRLAQQLAISGKKPTGCTTLAGYRIRRTSNSSYEIVANCGANTTCSNADYCVKEVDIPSNISLGPFPAPGSRFMFQVLAKGTDRSADTTITFTQDVTSDTEDVIITQSGEIR